MILRRRRKERHLCKVCGKREPITVPIYARYNDGTPESGPRDDLCKCDGLFYFPTREKLRERRKEMGRE